MVELSILIDNCIDVIISHNCYVSVHDGHLGVDSSMYGKSETLEPICLLLRFSFPLTLSLFNLYTSTRRSRAPEITHTSVKHCMLHSVLVFQLII